MLKNPFSKKLVPKNFKKQFFLNNVITIRSDSITIIFDAMTNELLFTDALTNENLYVKNPAFTALGRKMVAASIELIDELGFEGFTFRKLAKEIETTEASVYRYFESKHQLLLFLINIYWGHLGKKIELLTRHEEDSKLRLEKSIRILLSTEDEPYFTIGDYKKLRHLVTQEASKVYLHKNVDAENKAGFFLLYKSVVKNLSDIVLEICPSYPFPNALVSTIIEGSFQQLFFAEHLPRLTNFKDNQLAINDFYLNMTFSILDNYGKEK